MNFIIRVIDYLDAILVILGAISLIVTLIVAIINKP